MNGWELDFQVAQHQAFLEQVVLPAAALRQQRHAELARAARVSEARSNHGGTTPGFAHRAFRRMGRIGTLQMALGACVVAAALLFGGAYAGAHVVDAQRVPCREGCGAPIVRQQDAPLLPLLLPTPPVHDWYA
ncbi:MAG TPA: hypothetical protein VFA70_12985 [Dehalococcoidia bacterium]|nr:hypothetical protein [Dehalococcoidia bacterium]